MGAPSTAINRFDLSIAFSEFSLLANQRGFAGLRVLPAMATSVQAAEFLRIVIESLMGPIEDTKRAPKASYKRDDFEWTKDSFATDEHGVEEPMDDRLGKIYGDILRQETIHAQRAVNRILMAFEDEVAQAVFNTTTWSGGLTAAAGVLWTTAGSADPIADIDAAQEAIQGRIGIKPNSLVLSDFAFRKMIRTDRIEDLLKFSGHDDPKGFENLSAMAQLLDLEQIIVTRGYKSTAAKGQDVVLARMWDVTMAMVCNISTSMDLEDPIPSIGRTMMFSGDNAAIPGAGDSVPAVIVEEYREEPTRGGVIRARNDYQVKILHADAGQLITGVTA